MSQLVWLMTGCSSGFGEQFVHSILARGDLVVATARSRSKIAHFESLPRVTVLELDITASQDSLNNTVATAIAIHGHIDVLVNNAAYIAIGTIESLSSEDYLAQFNTNVFGTLAITRALLPHFRKRRSGSNVFISSLSGWIGHPGCSAYAGSKFALEGIVESLRAETAPFGINTLLIEPGRFRTKLLSSSNMKASGSTITDYAESSQNQLEGLAKEDQAQPGDPVKLVEIILDLVRQEGIAEGREVPLRLPLGIDCYDDIKAKCEETLKVLREWEDVCRSTDHADQS